VPSPLQSLQPDSKATVCWGSKEEPGLVRAAENIPLGNKEEIMNFKMWEVKNTPGKVY